MWNRAYFALVGWLLLISVTCLFVLMLMFGARPWAGWEDRESGVVADNAGEPEETGSGAPSIEAPAVDWTLIEALRRGPHPPALEVRELILLRSSEEAVVRGAIINLTEGPIEHLAAKVVFRDRDDRFVAVAEAQIVALPLDAGQSGQFMASTAWLPEIRSCRVRLKARVSPSLPWGRILTSGPLTAALGVGPVRSRTGTPPGTAFTKQ
ncbi:MAG: hypothetical protein GY953_41855 [bacterium]|nr:hypothetical protein [bacterium]